MQTEFQSSFRKRSPLVPSFSHFNQYSTSLILFFHSRKYPIRHPFFFGLGSPIVYSCLISTMHATLCCPPNVPWFIQGSDHTGAQVTFLKLLVMQLPPYFPSIVSISTYHEILSNMVTVVTELAGCLFTVLRSSDKKQETCKSSIFFRKDPVSWGQRFWKINREQFLHKAVKIPIAYHTDFNNNSRKIQQVKFQCKAI